jgi:hypothetical protein
VFILSISYLFTVISAEELLLDSKTIYPNTYAYIVQTEKDLVSLNNSSYILYTNSYTGVKKGLWINVAAFGNTVNELIRKQISL